MIFAKKKLPKDAANRPILPNLMLDGETIEWVQKFKYLGLTFDGPTLTWKEHIEDLRRICAERLRILRALTGTSWGPDRTNILNMYKTYIRAKITYGAAAVSSASKTNLDKLEVIQSSAIRIATGARKTSPRIALQVEAGMPPLKEYIKEICCRYYFKIKASTHHPTAEAVIEDDEARDRVWTPIFKKPFAHRTEDHLREWNIPKNTDITYINQPTAPPWAERIEIKPELLEEIDNNTSNEQKREVAERTINQRYEEHLKLYTDGSKIDNSTTSAVWNPTTGEGEYWKLSKGEARSIMGAELHAISKALHWTVLNSPVLTKNKVVILSDSKSGLQGIDRFSTKRYTYIIDQIKKTASTLQDIGITTQLQWIPSHVGVFGNEMADEFAKGAHEIPEITTEPLDLSEAKNLIKEEHTKVWQRYYEGVKDNLHIGDIKDKTSTWSWLPHKHRRVDIAMARLRIGHVGLNEYLTRFNMANNQNCSHCNSPETVHHFLIECRKYQNIRGKLKNSLRSKGVRDFTVKSLLGGGNYKKDVQVVIQNEVSKFLLETGEIKNL